MRLEVARLVDFYFYFFVIKFSSAFKAFAPLVRQVFPATPRLALVVASRASMVAQTGVICKSDNNIKQYAVHRVSFK